MIAKYLEGSCKMASWLGSDLDHLERDLGMISGLRINWIHAYSTVHIIKCN
jgi:hypothetical protein